MTSKHGSRGLVAAVALGFVGVIIVLLFAMGLIPNVFGGGGNGCGGLLSVLSVASPCFTLSANPVSVSMQPGQTITSTITVTGYSGFSAPVLLSATPVPNGVSITFNPNPVSPGQSSTATIVATTAAAAQTSTLTITASNGVNQQNTTPLVLTISTITPPPPQGAFSITANPGNVNIVPGNVGTSTITVTSTNGFAGQVALTTGTLNIPGTTITFNPSVVTLTPNQAVSTSMNIATTAASASNTAPVVITGTSGSLVETGTLSLSIGVSPGSNGFLSLSPYVQARNTGLDYDGNGNYYESYANTVGASATIVEYNAISQQWTQTAPLMTPSGQAAIGSDVSVSHDNSKVYIALRSPTNFAAPICYMGVLTIATQQLSYLPEQNCQNIFFAHPHSPSGTYFVDRTAGTGGIGIINEATNQITVVPYANPSGLNQITYDPYTTNHIFAIDYLNKQMVEVDPVAQRVVSVTPVPSPSLPIGIAPTTTGYLVISDRDTAAMITYNLNTKQWNTVQIPSTIMQPDIGFKGWCMSNGQTAQCVASMYSAPRGGSITGSANYHFLDRVVQLDPASGTISQYQLPQQSGHYYETSYINAVGSCYIYALHDIGTYSASDGALGAIGFAKGC